MGKIRHDGFMEIAQESGNGYFGSSLFRTIVDIKMLDNEIIHVFCRLWQIGKNAVLQPQLDEFFQLLTAGQIPQHQKLRHSQTIQLIAKSLKPVVAGVDAIEALAGRNICSCQHQGIAAFRYQGDVVVLGGFQG